MHRSFNLLDEPWLPVKLAGGEVQSMGLIELIRRSTEVVALAESSPPALVAQYRLLLALVHRGLSVSLGGWQERQRFQWFEQGVPVDALVAYLEQWRERFWLFHPQQPFMQAAVLDEIEETRQRLKPWTQIALASSSGNTPVVFDHSMDGTPASIAPAEAINLLLAYLQCVPGGLVKAIRGSDNAGPLANSAAVIPVGDHLAQTLCLGLHPSRQGEIEDLPAWEQPVPTEASLRAAPGLATGPNDRYTRLSRAVLLKPEADGQIRWLRFAAGQALAEHPDLPDPMVSLRPGSQGLVRLGFVEGRALWRDLPAMLPANTQGGGRPAAIMNWSMHLLARTGQPLSMRPFWVAGVASEQAKLLRWRLERLWLPQDLLSDPDRAAELQQAIEQAEALFVELRQLAGKLVTSSLPDSASKDTRSRARQLIDAGPLARTYYHGLQMALPRLLTQLAEDRWEAAEHDWLAAMRQQADAAWQQLLAGMGASPRVWKAQALHAASQQALLAGCVPATATTVSKEIPS